MSNSKASTLMLYDQEKRIEISVSQFLSTPELRRIVFKWAREEVQEAIDFLWENFSLREVTQREIDETNERLRKEEACMKVKSSRESTPSRLRKRRLW